MSRVREEVVSEENSHLVYNGENKKRKTVDGSTISIRSDAGIAPLPLEYLSGFGSHFSSEALLGALPIGQNNPQICPYGLYAEQLSGTAFTAPRSKNQRSWLYRIQPSVKHSPFKHTDAYTQFKSEFSKVPIDPNQMRWLPSRNPDKDSSINFVQGIRTMSGVGDPCMKSGLAIHLYTLNTSMIDEGFCNADGDMLIVPQEGVLRVITEFGILDVMPCEIVVIQRGIRFSIQLVEENAIGKGYILELFEGHFTLPDLGPIGANGLANPRDFQTPVAWYEDRDCEFTVTQKFGGDFFKATMDHSPFNVVGWHGNYAPYKYDLRQFNCMNSVTFDHPDPSIYTVLTCQSNDVGTAIADFVIFPPRWMVMEHTFRPPYFHRNIMSEFMGMIWGEYDSKAEGFVPGGASLHNIMTPHGPDGDTCKKAMKADLKPHKFDSGLAFMFESCYMLKVTQQALDAPNRDANYQKCWKDIPNLFKGPGEK